MGARVVLRLTLSVSILLVALSLGACGDESSPASDAAPVRAPEVGLEHIHGLGVDGGALYIATHTGLWMPPRASASRNASASPSRT